MAPALAVAAAVAIAPPPVATEAVAEIETALALPAPVEPAPLPVDIDTELSNRVAEILSDEPCGRIGPPQVTDTAEGRRLEGIVASEEGLARLRREVAALPGAPAVDIAVELVELPFCQTLLALPIAIEGRESMELNKNDGLYLDGDLLALEVGPVPVGGQLYVLFVDHDGSVQHLVPSQFEIDTAIRAGDVRELGAEQDILDVLDALGISIGNWRATAPFGRGLIMAFVAGRPLSPTPPETTQSAQAYFDYLANATSDNPVLWARYRWIDTRPAN